MSTRVDTIVARFVAPHQVGRTQPAPKAQSIFFFDCDIDRKSNWELSLTIQRRTATTHHVRWHHPTEPEPRRLAMSDCDRHVCDRRLERPRRARSQYHWQSSAGSPLHGTLARGLQALCARVARSGHRVGQHDTFICPNRCGGKLRGEQQIHHSCATHHLHDTQRPPRAL